MAKFDVSLCIGVQVEAEDADEASELAQVMYGVVQIDANEDGTRPVGGIVSGWDQGWNEVECFEVKGT